MSSYILRRVLYTIPVFLGMSMIVFATIHLIPGDPVRLMLGDTPTSPEMREQLRHELGLDDPLPVQYLQFLSNALTGDFGRSHVSNRPVLEIIQSTLPSTIQLALGALVVGTTLGLALGILAAAKAGSIWDALSMAVAMVGISMPSFWLGLLLIYVFALSLGWFPVLSSGGLRGLILPAISLGLYSVGLNARLVRSSLLEVLQQDYIRTARAKGLGQFRVVIGHALKNALLPVVTMIGVQIGMFLSGSVITETVFSRVGMGKQLIEAILMKDGPVIQGILLVTTAGYVAANLITDVAYSWLDPRIRHG